MTTREPWISQKQAIADNLRTGEDTSSSRPLKTLFRISWLINVVGLTNFGSLGFLILSPIASQWR